MNSPTIIPAVWTAEDRTTLREFLETTTGQRLVRGLQVEPSSSVTTASAERQLGVIHGWRMAVAFVHALVIPEEPEPTEKLRYDPLPPEDEPPQP